MAVGATKPNRGASADFGSSSLAKFKGTSGNDSVQTRGDKFAGIDTGGGNDSVSMKNANNSVGNINMGPGNDTFEASGGYGSKPIQGGRKIGDSINGLDVSGGEGNDTAKLGGKLGDYNISPNKGQDNSFNFQTKEGAKPDGGLNLSNFENFQFGGNADKSYSPSDLRAISDAQQ